ncbi:MAG TPA: SRPBCC family protein [Polyangiaceae bacterium]
MLIRCERSLSIASSSERTFALLDDFSATSRWLEQSFGIEKLSRGPNGVGTKIRYSYRDRARGGTLDGVVIAHVPSERLTLKCADAKVVVLIDFRIRDTPRGCELLHAIEITPKSTFVKLFAPLIRSQLPKRLARSTDRLRQLLEAEASTPVSGPT